MTHIPDDLCVLCGGYGLVPHRENCKIVQLTRERDGARASLAAARAVLRHLRNRGPCPVCESEGECYPDCALDVVLRGAPAPSPAAAARCTMCGLPMTDPNHSGSPPGCPGPAAAPPPGDGAVRRCEACSLPLDIHPVRWNSPGGLRACEGRGVIVVTTTTSAPQPAPEAKGGTCPEGMRQCPECEGAGYVEDWHAGRAPLEDSDGR